MVNHDDLAGFGVILLDRKLPDGNGDELLPFIRETAPETEVILITGYADLPQPATPRRLQPVARVLGDGSGGPTTRHAARSTR